MVCFWGQILASSKNGKTHNHSYSVFACIEWKDRSSYHMSHQLKFSLPKVEKQTYFLSDISCSLSWDPGRICHSEEWRHVPLSPCPAGTRLWTLLFVRSYLPIMSPDGTIFSLLHFFLQLKNKRSTKQCSIILMWELSLVARMLFAFMIVWVIKHSKRLPDFCPH